MDIPSTVTSFRLLLRTNFIQTLSQTLRAQDELTVVPSLKKLSLLKGLFLQVKLQVLLDTVVGMHACVLPALLNYEYSYSIFQHK